MSSFWDPFGGGGIVVSPCLACGAAKLTFWGVSMGFFSLAAKFNPHGVLGGLTTEAVNAGPLVIRGFVECW